MFDFCQGTRCDIILVIVVHVSIEGVVFMVSMLGRWKRPIVSLLSLVVGTTWFLLGLMSTSS